MRCERTRLNWQRKRWQCEKEADIAVSVKSRNTTVHYLYCTDCAVSLVHDLPRMVRAMKRIEIDMRGIR